MDVILAQITKNLVLCLCSILIDLQNLYSWGLNKREGVYFFLLFETHPTPYFDPLCLFIFF